MNSQNSNQSPWSFQTKYTDEWHLKSSQDSTTDPEPIQGHGQKVEDSVALEIIQ